jgi:hypothetical protein
MASTAQNLNVFIYSEKSCDSGGFSFRQLLLLRAACCHQARKDCCGKSSETGLDDRAGINSRIDSCHDAVAHDHAQLSSSAVRALSFDEGLDVGLVMTQVGADGTRAEVASFANHAVAHVRKVPDLAAVHNGAVLYLHCIAYSHVISDTGAGPDIAVRANIAAFADDDRPDDIGAGSNDCVFSN